MTGPTRLSVLALATALVVVLVWLTRGEGAQTEQLEALAGGAGDGTAYGEQALALASGPRSARDSAGETPRAAAGRADSEPAGLHGRVLRRADGVALSGIDLVIERKGRPAGRLRTDHLGAFRAELAADQLRLRPANDPRFRFVPAELALSPEHLSGKLEVLFLAEPAPQARVQGVVYDERTGEPLPDFYLALYDPNGIDERMTTDSLGRFESVESFGPGRLAVQPREVVASFSTYPIQHHVRSDASAELRVPVPVGPTYAVRVEPPGGYALDDLLAEVRAPGGAPVLGPPDWGRSRFRRGSTPWIRLRPDELDAAFTPPFELVVFTSDRSWVGKVPVDSKIGRYPDVLNVVLSAHAVLFGDVRGANGDAVVGARLSLVHQPSGEQRQGWTDLEGNFRIGELAGGEWLVRIEDRDHEPSQLRLELEPGAALRQRFELLDRAIELEVTGTLRTASGAFPGNLSLALERDGWVYSTPIVWDLTDEDGADPALWLGRFELTGLGPGEYRPRLTGEELPFEVAGLPTSLRPPVRDLRLVMEDRLGLEPLTVTLADSNSGEFVPEFQVFLQGQGWRRHVSGSEGRCVLPRVPRGELFQYWVRAPGYRMVVGEQRDFGSRGDGRELALRVERGWGAVFRCTSSETDEPLAGVTILLDGARFGPSGADGRILVGTTSRPALVSIAGGDWLLADSPSVDRRGTFQEDHWAGIPIQLEPAR